MAKQVLQCPSCGAPMRWKGQAPVVECRYCKTHVNVETEEVTEEVAAVRTQVRPRNLLVSWVIVGFILCTGIIPAVMGILFGDSGGDRRRPPFETIASLSMASTLEEIAEATRHEAWSEGSLCVYTKGGTIDYVCFGWHDDHPDHVKDFNIYFTEENPNAEAVKLWLDHYLGPRLHWSDSGYQMYWAGSHVHSADDMSHMGFYVDPDRDEGWETRIEWYWAVAIASVMGQQLEIPEDTRRRWLAQGYTPDQLAKLDVTDTVDEAQRSVPKRFPGAISDDHGESWTIPVDHPWIGEANFYYDNSEGGPLEYVYMTPIADNEFTHQKSLRNCISKQFGKSEHQKTDHLGKKFTYRWEPSGMSSIDLREHGLWVYLTDWQNKNASPSQWKKLMNSIDDCGR